MILLTGATGFLGRHIVSQLQQHLHARGSDMRCVRAVVRPDSDTGLLEAAGAKLVTVSDINRRRELEEACRGCRRVIHAAALFRMWGRLPNFWRTNVGGTAAVLEAARRAGVERFVHVSTAVVVGRPRPGAIVDETHPCEPQDFYQRTKLEAEQLALAYHRNCGLPVTVVRPGALYGPWGRYAFNRLFFEDPLRGWRIKVRGGHHLTFPAYAPDVARGILSALERGRAGRIYNLSGQSLTHNAINDTISDLAGISRRRLNVPTPAVLLLARAWTALSRFTGREPFYPTNLVHYVFQDWPLSSERARRELSFQTTPFRNGARETIKWYWEQGLL
ncbi:MAG TPA: NAD-dependent epimerase/dehydratase family protein [Candidatus Sulfomarinibacteraceae bacterium]|nr:NAD-dependent epimerase/dehydratase family protein [Candidatus Sulfomarinibacteraceae bacterium]